MNPIIYTANELRVSELARANFYNTAILFSETGPGCVAQASLELTVYSPVLSQLPSCLSHRCKPRAQLSRSVPEGVPGLKVSMFKFLSLILKINVHCKLTSNVRKLGVM